MATSSITSNEILVTMEFEKDTKNTVRFSEVHEDTEHPVLRTLYLSKPEFAKLGAPKTITVVIK